MSLPKPLQESADEMSEQLNEIEDENSTDEKSLPPLFRKAEWEPYIGPQGGEGWKNPDTDEVVYDDEPPGDTEFEFLDESMDPQDVQEGDTYAVFGEGGELINVDVIDVSEAGVTVQDQDGSERQVEIESLAERVIAEKNPDDVGISSGDVIETDYGFEITVDEIQSAGVMADDGYFYSFDDISDSELETDEDVETDEEESSSSDLEEDVVNDIVDRVGEMGGRDPYFNEDVLNELRNYSVDELQEIEDSAKRERDERDLIIEFQRLNPQEVQDQMLEEYVDEDPEDIYVPSSAIANALLEEYESQEEVLEFLESEYGNYEIPDEKSDTDASRIVNYVAYQQGDRDVEDVVNFTDGSSEHIEIDQQREEVKSSTEKVMSTVRDKMDPNVEAFTMASLEEINVDVMKADGKFTGSRIKIDPFVSNKEEVLLHEIGHQVHNEIGIDNMGIDDESYDNNIAPPEPEFGYNMDVTADRLGVDAPEEIEDAWQNYADGDATTLRDYQNRNLVEYAAVSFRYAMRNERQLERRDPKIKSFWDRVFSGGEQ